MGDIMYRCPQWKDCTSTTDPDSYCDHGKPHEWTCADGDECEWRPNTDGDCSEVCQPVTDTAKAEER